jgi:hypothetical protein
MVIQLTRKNRACLLIPIADGAQLFCIHSKVFTVIWWFNYIYSSGLCHGDMMFHLKEVDHKMETTISNFFWHGIVNKNKYHMMKQEVGLGFTNTRI